MRVETVGGGQARQASIDHQHINADKTLGDGMNIINCTDENVSGEPVSGTPICTLRPFNIVKQSGWSFPLEMLLARGDHLLLSNKYGSESLEMSKLEEDSVIVVSLDAQDRLTGHDFSQGGS
ncbi:MAG: hypothetical protein HC794_06965 [Nitrospiraceae bacterium]|nr:hypothetical protein [Nitrospiraceae bacterium]